MEIKCVVLSYNHPDLTARCMRSALQSFPASSVVLVHNGSEEKFVSRLRTEFTGVDHLVLTQNFGYSGGANRGLKRAFESADQVLFLTNDCELEAFPARLADARADLPEKFIMAPLILIRSTGRVDSFGGRLDLKRGHLEHLRDVTFGDDSNLNFTSDAGSELRNYIPGTAYFLSKAAFERLGGFDESLGTYWEDVDFSLRAPEAGVSLLRDAHIRIRHGVGKTCHKDTYYTTFLFQRNARIVSRRHVDSQHKLSLEVSLGLSAAKLLLTKIRRRKFKDLRLLLKAVSS